jgi:CubicO group peptidase (beta-lactamase class C family)
MHAFAQMLLQFGRHGRDRVLSRPSVEIMTADQLTPEQKSRSAFAPGDYWDSHGWGFGVATVTRRDDLTGSVGSYGWAGGLGTIWSSDPSEDLVTILLTQRAFTSPIPPNVVLDFLTGAHQAIDD